MNYECLSNLPQDFRKKTKKAEKIVNEVERQKEKAKVNEKLAYYKSAMPEIKTKYELYLEANKDKEENNEDEKGGDNSQQ